MPTLFEMPTPEKMEEAAREAAEKLDAIAESVMHLPEAIQEVEEHLVFLGDKLMTRTWKVRAQALELKANLFELLGEAFATRDALVQARKAHEAEGSPEKPTK